MHSIGANTVTLTGTDSQKFATADAVVTIVDTTAPTVITQDITVILDPTTYEASISPVDVNNGTTDACDNNITHILIILNLLVMM